MDSEVVVPQLEPSYDVEADKPLEVVNQELEQKAIERDLKAETEKPQFPLIRQHFVDLINSYNSVRTLVGLSDKGFVSEARAKAAIVNELEDLLSAIDQLSEVDSGDGNK